jgi:hypothetical protein
VNNFDDSIVRHGFVNHGASPIGNAHTATRSMDDSALYLAIVVPDH